MWLSVCYDHWSKIILIVPWHNWKKRRSLRGEVKEEKKCGMKYSCEKKVTFQIDFRHTKIVPSILSMHSAISRLYFHTLSDFAYPAFYSPHSKVVVLYIGPSPTLSWINSPFRSFSRYLKKRNKKRVRNGGLEHSHLFSRSTERTIRLLCPRPPFFSWLHFCPLLDILFYWTKPSFLPSFLPS